MTTNSQPMEHEPQPPFPEQPQHLPGQEAKMSPRPEYQAPEYRAAGKLEGMVALITGADSGIGRAVALLYAREGADVAIVYLNEHRDAEETKRAIEREGRRCILIAGDIGDAQFCSSAVERCRRELGGLDILVNNAAMHETRQSIEEISDELLERTFRTNVFGTFYMTRAALPHLKPGSSIINTGSVVAQHGSKDLLDYSATKGAIHTFTRSLSKALVDRGIRVNCVAPGPVWTPLIVAGKPEEKVKHFGENAPYGRPAQPEELAPAYVFLASNADSSYITGDIIEVFGGRSAAG